MDYKYTSTDCILKVVVTCKALDKTTTNIWKIT